MLPLRLQFPVLMFSGLTATASLAGTPSAPPHRSPSTVTITLTTHGIPHIRASNYRGLGYGEGYAMAENDLCGLAATFITYSGERALRFGEDKGDLNYLFGRTPINNAASDFALRLMINSEVVEHARRDQSPQIRALLEGYAQGFNAYLRAHTQRPQACQDPEAVRPITVDDVLRRTAGGSMFLSSGLVLQQLYDAAPPTNQPNPQASNTQTPGTSSSAPMPTSAPRPRMASLAPTPASAATAPRMASPAPTPASAATAPRTASFAPTPTSAATAPRTTSSAALADDQPSLAGSNGYAFGKDDTDNKSGLLLGNPHFFWDGPNRFVQLHLTIPGEYDAMGVTLPGLPLVTIGFNRNIAWTHTVSTDLRGTIYRLKLDPTNPTHYLVDGQSKAMAPKRITLQVRTNTGATETRTHDFWMTELGPVLTNPAMPWTAEYAFVLSDANQHNDRPLQQWLEIGKSQNVEGLDHSLRHTLGLPWINTIAADRNGHAYYADISVAPNLDAQTLHECSIEDHSGLTEFFAVMDGSRSACRPSEDRSSPQPDLLPARARPALTRTDFVANSNGSYWLTNAAAPLEGFSPVMGKERTPQSLRTRQDQVQVADRLQGKDGLPGNRMSQPDLEKILFSGRSLQAELVIPSLLEACRERSSIEPTTPSGTPTTSSATTGASPAISTGTSEAMPTTPLTASPAQSYNARSGAPADSASAPRSNAPTDSTSAPRSNASADSTSTPQSVASTSANATPDSSARIARGCAALSTWNLHYDLASTGSQVFTEFVRQLRRHGEDLGTTPDIWRVPFNAADPVHTPRDFDANNPAVFKALSAAVERLDKADIALDAKLGDIQFATRKGVHIPLHGGPTYSAMHATLTPNVGYTDPMQPSNSYIQVVTFDPTGPVADAILASSQCPDPNSPYFDDQTWAYSRKEWTRLPFTPAAIKAAAIAPPTDLRVPQP